MMKDGLLLLAKETGYTSHDVVQKARRLMKQKKIGHCGTLDPNATGLLVLTLGKATRLTRFLIGAPKIYDGTIQLGAATNTYDAAGEITSTGDFTGIDRAAVAAAMSTFEGVIQHVPPAYSAKKVQGRKLYEFARAGEEVEIEAKEVEVYEFVPTSEVTVGVVSFRLGCASGTYARTLAHDVGQKLGCGAHLATLRRLRVGPFELSSALTLAELETRTAGEPPELGAAWIPFDEIPLPFPTLTLDARDEQRLKNGQTVLSRELQVAEGDWLKLANRRGEMIAVGSVTERIGERGVGIVQPRVVFQ
ncbi:MAG: tRNA pseudouridine(55) synthase TruB [Thermoanaerobaculia bacterium]|nr:tRNA pseudouridine(55) synthase TruB [Thermoanaerobaculia bacterium]